jgi:hypothetical protein
LPQTQTVERAIHGWSHQVTKASVNHDEGVPWPLGVVRRA